MLARRKIALLGAATYLAAFFCASLYPFFDHRTFSGLAAVLLAWPWVDYIASATLPLAVALNTVLIYVVLAVQIARKAIRLPNDHPAAGMLCMAISSTAEPMDLLVPSA